MSPWTARGGYCQQPRVLWQWVRLGLRLAPQGKGALGRKGRCQQIMGEMGRQEKGEEEKKKEEEEDEELRNMQG